MVDCHRVERKQHLEYRHVGKYGIKVSEVALGSWLTFGNATENEAAEACIDRAYEIGINFFDTANAYAGGRSEEVVGRALSSVCIEEFKYNPDGSFPTILPTKEGPAPVGHLDPYRTTKAATIAWEAGIRTVTSPTVGVYVTDIGDGDYIRVSRVDFGSRGAKALAACVAAAGGASIEVHLDSVDGPIAGSVPVPGTAGSEQWKVQRTPMSGAKGVHDVFFVFKGPFGTKLFDFLWWNFSK